MTTAAYRWLAGLAATLAAAGCGHAPANEAAPLPAAIPALPAAAPPVPSPAPEPPPQASVTPPAEAATPSHTPPPAAANAPPDLLPPPQASAPPAPAPAPACAPEPPKRRLRHFFHHKPKPPPPAPPPPAKPSAAIGATGASMTVLGKKVVDSQGEDLGRVVDVLVDDSGQAQAAVVDFGGFLGVGNRKVAVSWAALEFKPGDADHPVVLNIDREQLQAAPEFKVPPPPAPAAAGK
ncbi:MAG: PRC-barrel domain-containing protein [Nevskia sp.]|nr:PRC-barrel domain-containing protein [Nevskia sp.]